MFVVIIISSTYTNFCTSIFSTTIVAFCALYNVLATYLHCSTKKLNRYLGAKFINVLNYSLFFPFSLIFPSSSFISFFFYFFLQFLSLKQNLSSFVLRCIKFVLRQVKFEKHSRHN